MGSLPQEQKVPACKTRDPTNARLVVCDTCACRHLIPLFTKDNAATELGSLAWGSSSACSIPTHHKLRQLHVRQADSVSRKVHHDPGDSRGGDEAAICR